MDLIEVTGNTNRHPWELSRGSCIIKEIKKIECVGRVLDIGCGDGYFDRQLVQMDNRVEFLIGYDPYLKDKTMEGSCRWTNDFSEIEDGTFDLILMMDVLEHVKDDSEFFEKICRKAKKNGHIIVTVPAFMKLYSLHDKELKHYRRYNRKMLRTVVKSADCSIDTESYFYAILIILRILTRNRTENLGNWKYDRNHIVTRGIEKILNADYMILRFLSKLHVYLGGLSLLMIARNGDE